MESASQVEDKPLLAPHPTIAADISDNSVDLRNHDQEHSDAKSREEELIGNMLSKMYDPSLGGVALHILELIGCVYAFVRWIFPPLKYAVKVVLGLIGIPVCVCLMLVVWFNVLLLGYSHSPWIVMPIHWISDFWHLSRNEKALLVARTILFQAAHALLSRVKAQESKSLAQLDAGISFLAKAVYGFPEAAFQPLDNERTALYWAYKTRYDLTNALDDVEPVARCLKDMLDPAIMVDEPDEELRELEFQLLLQLLWKFDSENLGVAMLRNATVLTQNTLTLLSEEDGLRKDFRILFFNLVCKLTTAASHLDKSQASHNVQFEQPYRQIMYPEPEEGISIDELIDLNHEVLSSLPADQSNARCTVLFNVSLLLRARYEERGKMQDLNDVITHIEQAVELSSDSNVSHLLTWLGRNLIRRFKTTEANPVDLNRAIDQFRSADALFIHGEEYAGTNHCHLLLELSEALEMRSNHTRQSYHRGKSDQVDARSGAVNLDLHPTSSILESTTDSTRFSSSENSPGLIDLDDSIQCIKQCIELMGEDPIELGHSLDRLSKALYLRFEILGTVDDLEEAIRSNTEDTPIPQSDRRSFQHFANLGACYWARYSAVSGANTDLQTAIRLTRRSLELDSCRGAGRGAVFASLANCLVYRDRELSHDQLDVTEAIQCARSALSLLTDLSHQASTYLILSKALQGLYDYSNAMRDLEAAIRAAEHAVALQGGSDEFGQLSILLYIRWQRMKSDEDLRGAIQFGQEAISPKLPALYGNRGTLVANLARCLETRYLISKDRAHLEETINLLRNTLSSSTQMINGRAECLSRLASALQRLYRLEPDPTLLREVRDMVIEAFDHGDPDLTKLFRMAGDWVAGAIEPSLRLEMYPVLLDITQRHLLIHPDIMCQHRKLLSDTPLGELSANVAGDAITAQRLQEAVEIIEKGRLLLLRCLMALRTPVDEVRLVDPILAERLEEIAVRREELAQKPFHLLSPSMKSTTLDSDLKEQAALVHEWERLLVEIRSHDELRGFLKPPSFSALRESASKGPVIVINVCKRRCDAIIVLSTGAPVLVELTKISYKTIVRMRQELIFSQRALVSPPDALLLLRTLWIKIVEPIVNRLLELDFKEGQRIWWCPSSIATYLPFHAAGPYQEGMKNLPDYFISSYTASLEALIRARSAKSDSQATSALPRVLFVGHPGMEDELDSVKLELAILESREDISTTVLFKEAATPSAVLHHLPKHPWVHLACHGKLDEWSPVGSYFQLHNRDPLLVREILHARLANARLAVLTACYTAAPGPMTPDEGLHLASALQFAGFSSVIGTLWEMFDSEAQVITESFYNELMRLGGDHEDSARALHYATEQQRLSGKGPRLWMMLIHIGA